jgi:hypothetical protein
LYNLLWPEKSSNTEKKLEIEEGATHLFEETRTLEKASLLARDFFLKWL